MHQQIDSELLLSCNCWRSSGVFLSYSAHPSLLINNLSSLCESSVQLSVERGRTPATLPSLPSLPRNICLRFPLYLFFLSSFLSLCLLQRRLTS